MLPDFPILNDPTRNLAGARFDTPRAIPNPGRTLYRAWDGTPIGYSTDCDPLTDEPMLSGLLVPSFLEEKRVTWGQEWALPVLVAASSYVRGGSALKTALLGLGAYYAPLPVAGVLAAAAVARVRVVDDGLSGLPRQRRCVRWGHTTNRRGKRIRVCRQYA